MLRRLQLELVSFCVCASRSAWGPVLNVYCSGTPLNSCLRMNLLHFRPIVPDDIVQAPPRTVLCSDHTVLSQHGTRSLSSDYCAAFSNVTVSPSLYFIATQLCRSERNIALTLTHLLILITTPYQSKFVDLFGSTKRVTLTLPHNFFSTQSR